MPRSRLNTWVGLCLAACVVLGAGAPQTAGARSAPHRAAKRPPRRRPAPRCRPTRHHRCPARRRRSSKADVTPPAARTGGPQSVLATSAALTGSVNPNGTPATYWFQYGTSKSYGAKTGSGTASRSVSVSSALGGLKPLTLYHYRLVASHCGGCALGTSYGAAMSFTTLGYQNPVWGNGEAADPFVLDNGGQHRDFWAFTTGNLFPMLHSSDLVHWSSAGAAMRALPSWVVQSGDWHPWAPSVVQFPGACPGPSPPAAMSCSTSG